MEKESIRSKVKAARLEKNLTFADVAKELSARTPHSWRRR